MADIDRESLRSLAEWRSNGVPVSSLYLDVDGRRFPRKQDYVVRAEPLCHELKRQAAEQKLGKEAVTSVSRDVEGIQEYVRDLDRGSTRGLALFSASKAGLWEAFTVTRPLQDRATVADQPYVLPLEALIETYETFCTVLVDREKARILLAKMGHVKEESQVFDEVPGQHDQGGWSQGRYQRHIEEHELQHLKHVAEVVLRYFKRHRFDHLIVAGPEELVPDLERHLHDYLKRRVAARVTLPITASVNDVLARSLAVEEEIEAERERRVLERVEAEAAAGRHAVTGLDAVLEALNDGRVETLVVPFGLSQGGWRCTACGRLATDGDACRICGGAMETVPDVVESAVATALRQNSRVETLTFFLNRESDRRHHEVGALLRF